MSYDSWKATNRADEELGAKPQPPAAPEIITGRSYSISREFDWSARLDSYEGGDPIGYGATEKEAIADLLDQMEDR